MMIIMSLLVLAVVHLVHEWGILSPAAMRELMSRNSASVSGPNY